MDLTALLLSRLQFAFTVSFHIIFPSFTIGLAAWLTVLEALHLWTGRPVYRLVFEFWLKIFGVAFGLGVVSGIVMAFQFGSNWSVLTLMSGPIQGPLLSYETFTASALEASFFGVLLFGRSRVSPGLNYGEHCRAGERVSSGFADSAVNTIVSKRFTKKQQKQWTPRGAHLLLQVRTRTLDCALRSLFQSWSPGLANDNQSEVPIPRSCAAPNPIIRSDRRR